MVFDSILLSPTPYFSQWIEFISEFYLQGRSPALKVSEVYHYDSKHLKNHFWLYEEIELGRGDRAQLEYSSRWII